MSSHDRQRLEEELANKCFRNYSPEEEKKYRDRIHELAMVSNNKEVSWRHEPVSDPVSSPNHYLKLGYECIEIIASALSQEAFKGYCMGNFLKYRFRMGDKDEMKQDFNKSKEYLMLYDKYSHLCKED